MRSSWTCAAALIISVALTTFSHAASMERRQYTELKVGQKAILHSVRGECGKQPGSWAQIKKDLPAVKYGVLSDGGIGTRNSGRCKGRTPSRGVVYTAKSPGKESFKIDGDTVTVLVK